MKYYKDSNNRVYGFNSDGSQDAYIPAHLIPITKEECDILRKEVGRKAEEELAKRLAQIKASA